MPTAKSTSRRRQLLPADQRTSWTRQDLLTLHPYSYNFWAKVPRQVLPYVIDGKNYVYDSVDVAAFLSRLKLSSLELMIAEAGEQRPMGRRRGRPRKPLTTASAGD